MAVVVDAVVGVGGCSCSSSQRHGGGAVSGQWRQLVVAIGNGAQICHFRKPSTTRCTNQLINATHPRGKATRHPFAKGNGKMVLLSRMAHGLRTLKQ